MPVYEIEAPDGRILEVEGATPPTEQDLDGIFGSLPPAKEMGVIDNIKNALKWTIDTPRQAMEVGHRNVELGTLESKDIVTDLSFDEKQRIKELENKPRPDYGEVDNLAKKGYVAAFESLPIMFETFKSGLAGGAAAGGTALALGQLGPQVGLPEEIITVPTAGIWGYRIAAGKRIGEIEAGLARNELKQIQKADGEFVGDSTVNAASLGVGGVNALLEMTSLSAMLKTFPQGKILLNKIQKSALSKAAKDPTVRQQLNNVAKAYGKAAITEGMTEAAQEATVIIADSLIKDLNGVDKDNLSKQAARIIDAGVNGFGAALFIGGAGSTITTTNILVKQGIDKKTAKAQAEAMTAEEQDTFIQENVEVLKDETYDFKELQTEEVQITPKEVAKVEIQEQVTDSYKGQINYIDFVEDVDGNKIATLEYNIFNDEINIDMIKVEPEYQRQGLATKLLQNLGNKYPDTQINTGMQTENSAVLLKENLETTTNQEYADKKNELNVIQSEIKRLENKVENDIELSATESEGFNDLYDQKRILLDEIRNIPEEFTRIKRRDITEPTQEVVEEELTDEKREQDYSDVVARKTQRTGIIDQFKQQASKTGIQTKDFRDKIFVPISTRLSKIDERLKHIMRRYEFNTNVRNKESEEKVVPFIKATTKMSTEDYATLDYALKNSDTTKVDELISKYDLQEDFAKVREVLDKIYNNAQKVGLDVNYLEDYFPRQVLEVDEFLAYLQGTEQWSAIEQALKEIDPDNVFTNEEKASYVNNMLRGMSRGQITLAAPGNVKARIIDYVTPEMNAFYKDSNQSLLNYISKMNDNIEARRFFGKDEKTLDESIGNYAKQLVEEGMITAKQEQELKQILTARFNQRGTYGAVQTFKNFSYIATMGSPISAITQIGDLGLALYKNGAMRTAKGFLASVMNNAITKEDLGIDKIAQEFSNESTSAKAVSKVFDAVGLTWMDKLGKESLINGAYDKLQSAAKKDTKAFNNKMTEIFGDAGYKVKKDLQQGNLTEDIKYLLFSELADVQPIALSEMPEAYLSGGNSRIFYMLKTYTLKLFDIYHNDIFRQMETDPKQGLTNLVKLTSALALSGVTADVIKDILLGRDIDPDDLVLDNILKLMGFSKWQIYKSKRDGIFTTLLQSILPPVPLLDDIYKDATRKHKKSPKDWNVWQRVPLVGKMYYWWFGGGTANKKKKSSL